MVAGQTHASRLGSSVTVPPLLSGEALLPRHGVGSLGPLPRAAAPPASLSTTCSISSLPSHLPFRPSFKIDFSLEPCSWEPGVGRDARDAWVLGPSSILSAVASCREADVPLRLPA